MNLTEPRQLYERRVKRYNNLLNRQRKTEKLYSNLRLAFFAAGLGAVILLYVAERYIFAAAALVVFTAVFIALVIRHSRLIERIKHATALRDINSLALKRLNGQWNTFSDNGGEFMVEKHPYSADLDIFGKNSLFQWTNTAQTVGGRQRLKELLVGEPCSRQDILHRQEAVKELGPMLSWRQRFMAEGMIDKSKLADPAAIISWAKESNKVFRQPWVIAVFKILPFSTIALLVAGLVMQLVPPSLPAALLLIQFGFLAFNHKRRARLFSIAEKYAGNLRVYYKMLLLFEKESFKSPLLKRAKAELSSGGAEAYRQVEKLSAIMDSVANRRNAFFLVINILTLWDFQNIIALEKWKRQCGHNLEKWFAALGEIEALASLAVIRFDNPDWAMPQMREGEDEAYLRATAIGHPLLAERVCNHLTVGHAEKVLLITGSNMSGKSTLLRTAGINLVLAYAGAPVCARSFEASLMKIYTSMRVRDNLGESVSSFYAELLRIKEIVVRATAGEKVFFLLDEILKGTNSRDRHTGAKVLINKLSLTNAIGLVSTHDLELCDLAEDNCRVANYHFQEYYTDGEINFDYILHPGPSGTRNALYLMRLAGIDVGESDL